MAPSWHDWKIVDWDVKPQHNQPTNLDQQNLIWIPILFSQNISTTQYGEIFNQLTF